MAEITIYVGLCDDMVAEVAAFDPRACGISSRECKFLVMPGGVDRYDTDWASSRKVALEIAREHARGLNATVAWI